MKELITLHPAIMGILMGAAIGGWFAVVAIAFDLKKARRRIERLENPPKPAGVYRTIVSERIDQNMMVIGFSCGHQEHYFLTNREARCAVCSNEVEQLEKMAGEAQK